MWDAAKNIGTPFVLIAFIVAVVFHILRQRAIEARRLIELAPDASRGALIEATLETYHMKTDNLTREAKFQLINKVLDDKTRRFRMITVASVLIAVLLLVAIVVIALNQGARSVEKRADVALVAAQSMRTPEEIASPFGMLPEPKAARDFAETKSNKSVTIDRTEHGKYDPTFTVGFTFVNRGDLVAAMWQIGVEVMASEVDPTPDNRFYYVVDEHKSLIVSGMNYGWGDSIDTRMYLDGPFLGSIFPKSVREFRGTIRTDSEVKIAVLSPSMIGTEQIELIQTLIDKRDDFLSALPSALKRDGRGVETDPGFSLLRADEAYFAMNYEATDKQVTVLDIITYCRPLRSTTGVLNEVIRAVPVNSLSIVGSCVDQLGRRHSIKSPINPRGLISQLWVDQHGFWTQELSPLRPVGSYPDTAYVVEVDPRNPQPERKLPISRDVPSGQSDRFIVTFSSSISCNSTIRLKFYFNDRVIASEPIKFNIWCPRSDLQAWWLKTGTVFQKKDNVWVLMGPPEPPSQYDPGRARRRSD